MFSSDYLSKDYTTKARSLIFNLKKNERLRQDLCEGAVAPESLVHMSAQELATEDKKKVREGELKSGTMERRSDWSTLTRNERLLENGIDPNKGGEFTCRKCKGNKTTHREQQTRSADEPMTVFVCCLTCGNRWRC